MRRIRPERTRSRSKDFGQRDGGIASGSLSSQHEEQADDEEPCNNRHQEQAFPAGFLEIARDAVALRPNGAPGKKQAARGNLIRVRGTVTTSAQVSIRLVDRFVTNRGDPN